MRFTDPRILRLLAFLTRRQAWLSPLEISHEFRLDGKRISARTVQRWFTFLRERGGGFVYYPYPKANTLGLQDVFVRARGVRNPEVLGILPFASSITVEVGLGDYEPFVSQSYWVPGPAMKPFREFWQAARALGHVADVDVFPTRNTHYLYSPFHDVIRRDGDAELTGKLDNDHFRKLVTRHLREPFEVKLGDRIGTAPVIIPTVVERIWAHYSSRQVWNEIRAKGEDRIIAYGGRDLGKAVRRPGYAIQWLQKQWRDLLRHFDDVFLQPRVMFDWTSLKRCMFLSVFLQTRSVEDMIEAAVQSSQLSIYTAFRPGLDGDLRCHLSSFLPNDQLLPSLEVAKRFHAGAEPPFAAVQDKQALLAMFKPAYCKLDWRLFDPRTLSWNFDSEAYLGQLEQLPHGAPTRN